MNLLSFISGFAIGAGIVGVLWCTWVLKNYRAITQGRRALKKAKNL